MKRLLTLLAVVTASLALAEDLVIPPVQKRIAVVEALQKRVQTNERSADAFQKNPFSMKGFESLSVAVAAPQTNAEPVVAEHDLLSVLADKVDARGRFVMNGEVMLLVGGKKLRVGSKVPVNHEGLVYELEISAIDTAKFTIRYKTEEFTRPITRPSTKKP
ncbi:hypothetical protein [Nibricoccus sp. IMCC34717]|uniref:hypothetical protein n=1 Tax=Nibricoccus sp. IMCC34717 TaxID=3034021 RepID=UPI00385010AC